jgi:hypothetical protein
MSYIKQSFQNTNFSNMKETLDQKLIYMYNEFNIGLITPFEVKFIIEKLNIEKSTGLYGIRPNIIKYCGDYITPIIASIINNSFKAYISQMI